MNQIHQFMQIILLIFHLKQRLTIRIATEETNAATRQNGHYFGRR